MIIFIEFHQNTYDLKHLLPSVSTSVNISKACLKGRSNLYQLAEITKLIFIYFG